MAGDWLKMDCSTPDKPEVLAITARMGWDDADLTVGKLFRVWRWFDQQTTNGNAVGVTSALLDRIAGVSGFAQAMQSVGWLIVLDTGLELPNFEKHNGATAKARAQTAKRVANHRASDGCNAESNAATVTAPLAREEKRREERNTSASTAAAFDADTGHFQIPDLLMQQWRGAYPALSLDVELSKASAWLIANPKNRKSNYARFLTNWLSKAQDRAPRVENRQAAFEGGV